MGDGHDHHVDVSELRDRQRRVLWWVLAANGGFLVVEIIGGIAFSSLALLADAAHMATDVSGLAIALVAQTLLGRPSSRRHSYGLQRAEVLGAMANGILLVATAGWIMFEAVQRFGDEVEVEGGGLLVVATVGLVVNVVSALLLARVRGRSLNLRGAYVHMLADAAGSVAAIAAGVAVVVADAYWVDAAASIFIAVLVLWSSWGLLRDTVHVLLEGSPSEMDAERVLATIRGTGVVDDVHHLHVWSLASDAPALSAHLVVDGSLSMHEAQERGAVVRRALEAEFGVIHSTLELECHPCAADEHP